MKFIAPLLALVVAVVAQNNAISIPNGGLQVTAGQPITITWTNPSSSTVTIKLQQGSGVTPTTGITVANVQASTKTATFTIPADQVNNSQYNIEIIDDTDPSNYNFTPGFVVAGATCVGLCDGSSTSTTGSASSAGTASSTATGSSASSAASSASASASSASVVSSAVSASSSAVSSASSASAASSSASSSSKASASASSTTAAPSSQAVAVKAQAGLVMALVAAVAAF